MIPVMVLPRCSLLPHGLLPLFIFEHRYRQMLSHALHNERFFCVGMHSGHEDDDSDDAIHGHSTAALVRACVHHEDGTSHVILQGVQRVRFTGWHQRAPFRMARIEKVVTVISDPDEIPGLRRKVLTRVCRLVSGRDATVLKEKMCRLTDTEIFADFVTANFVRDPAQCQQTLAMCDLNERLRYLWKILKPV
jgi:Lon protease-like protein